MRVVAPLDVAWLYLESSRTPMHVGCVQIFSRPRGAGPDFIREALAQLRDLQRLASPFNLKPGSLPVVGVAPVWVEERQPDMLHHVRHRALPRPAGDAELNDVVAELLSEAMDPTRPLWECHLLEGLRRGRFALVIKMHHALVDGVGGMRLLQAALSTDAHERGMLAPWAPHPHPHAPARPAHAHEDTGEIHGGLRHVLDLALEQLRSQRGLLRGVSAMGAAVAGRPRGLAAPYRAPKTQFNGRISPHRQFSTLQLPLKVLRTLAHRAEVTLNDVMLEICASALRAELERDGALPDGPLVAGVPVSLRPEGDGSVGTAVSFLMASLATHLPDPLQRLAHIHASTDAAKRHLQQMHRLALTEYTLVLMAPFILELLTGLGGRGHPVFNLVVSNVPGPSKRLYFNGARMDAMYPTSILTHGQALNITALSYAGQLNIGVTACRDALPSVQRLTAAMQAGFEALVEALPAP